GDQSAGTALQRAKDGIAPRPQLAVVGHEELTAAGIEAGVEGGDNLDGPMRPDPSPFAPRRHPSSEEPARPLEHPALPQGRVAPQVPILPDQPVGIADVLDP